MTFRKRIVKLTLTAVTLFGSLTNAIGQKDNVCFDRRIPRLTDVIAKSGIKFLPVAAPGKKYNV